MRAILRSTTTAAFLSDDNIRRQALWQLAAYGFVRLTGAPITPGEIETVVSAFGIVRETNYGRVFDVRTKVDAANLADTALALAPHTDNPYRLSPPDIQILHCLQSAGSGGQSLLVDGLAAVHDLTGDDRRRLSTEAVRFAWSDGATHLETTQPVISLKADGTLDRIRYNPRSMQATISRKPGMARGPGPFRRTAGGARSLPDLRYGPGRHGTDGQSSRPARPHRLRCLRRHRPSLAKAPMPIWTGCTQPCTA